MSVRKRIRKIKHLQSKSFICVLERPNDAKNIATAIRNISAFGVTKLYIVGGTHSIRDFISSRTNKHLSNLSSGASKWVFVKYYETTEECFTHLKNYHYTSVITSSHIKGKENIDLYDGTFTQKRLAVWFGNESKGVSEEAVKNSDLCIQIPMGGIVESLNLGTSTGIVLSFISYQRLKFVYENKKVRFRPKGIANLKMRTWRDFINPHR